MNLFQPLACRPVNEASSCSITAISSFSGFCPELAEGLPESRGTATENRVMLSARAIDPRVRIELNNTSAATKSSTRTAKYPMIRNTDYKLSSFFWATSCSCSSPVRVAWNASRSAGSFAACAALIPALSPELNTKFTHS